MKKWLLPAIVLSGLGLRLWGIGFGLPGTFFVDETIFVNKAVAMGTGDLNPHYFAYPTFHIYLVAFIYGIIFVTGWFFGLINSAQDFQALFFADPTVFYLALRVLSALFGVATIWVVWKIGNRVYSKQAGLLGALFLSLCYFHVRESHFGVNNIPMTFWTTLFVLFLCKLAEQEKSSWQDHILAGAVLGLGISTKYPAVYFAPAFLFVHFWRLKALAFKRAGLPEHGKFICAAGITVLAFFITSPFVFLDHTIFMFHYHKSSSMVFTFLSFSGLIDSFVYYLNILRYGMGLPLLILAGVGFVSVFRKNSKELVLAVFSLVYFLFFLSKAITIDRYIDPLLPVICLFAAGACQSAFQLLERYRWRMKEGIIIALLAVLIYPSLRNIFLENRLLCRKDTRIQAREWIHGHIPSGTNLAVYAFHYNHPPLHESRELLEEKHRFVTTLGAMRGGNYSNIFAGPRQFAVKLAQPNYPPLPNYYVYKLRDSLEKNEIPMTWDLRADSKFNELKAKGIRYIVFTSHPTQGLSSTGRNLEKNLHGHARLLAEFDPLKDGASIRGMIYPSILLVPLAGHSSLKRIGPKISIYKI